MPIDIGEDTGRAAGMTDAELDRILDGADTADLDAAVETEYGSYLRRWTHQIEGGRVQESAEDTDYDALAKEWIAAILSEGEIRESKDDTGREHDAIGRFGTGGASGASPEAPDGVISKAADFISRAPAAITAAFQRVAAKVKTVAVNKFTQFEARYGRKGAIAIMGAVIATLPLPGSGLATLAVAESVRFVVGK